MFKNDVWERSGEDQLSSFNYNLAIAGTLIWGFLINSITVSKVDTSWLFSLNPIAFFIGSLVCMIAGVVMFAKSDNPAISFMGYNLVVLPMGLLVTFAVHNVSPDIVLNTIQLTGLIVGLMMVLGSIFPSFFLSLGKMLFMMLLSFVLVEIGLMLFTDIDRGFMDYIAAGLFSAYIAYDWARANSIPRTLDNAIDSAASMYIDIINLFLRLLNIAQND